MSMTLEEMKKKDWQPGKTRAQYWKILGKYAHFPMRHQIDLLIEIRDMLVEIREQLKKKSGIDRSEMLDEDE